MSNSSILGGDSAATRAAGRDADLLGPSDSSDTGSDVQGERTMPTGADNAGELGAMTVDLDSDSDAMGTGERASAAGDAGPDGADILPDQIVQGADVDGEVLVDADFTDDVEALGDDEDSDATDAEAPDEDAVEPSTNLQTEATDDAGGRVFTLPPGTIEATEDR